MTALRIRDTFVSGCRIFMTTCEREPFWLTSESGLCPYSQVLVLAMSKYPTHICSGPKLSKDLSSTSHYLM
jgi:hypothetical protein